MKAHTVDPRHSQAAGDLFGILVGREAGGAVHADAPKAPQRAVLKAKLLAVGPEKTVLAGGSFVREHERNIHRHRIHVTGRVDVL